jgi:hypothetical protein
VDIVDARARAPRCGVAQPRFGPTDRHVARARVTARFIGDASIDRNGFTGSGAMREKKNEPRRIFRSEYTYVP